MRLWTLSPVYLDSKGLGGLWNESLLAKNCISCNYDLKINRYSNHPQLNRFKNCSNDKLSINFYLLDVYNESLKRNYKYNVNKINYSNNLPNKIQVNKGQILYEIWHLKNKLIQRQDKNKLELLIDDVKNNNLKLNKLFTQNNNMEIESWEIVNLNYSVLLL